MTCVMLKKILTLLYVREKKRDLIKEILTQIKVNHPYPPPPPPPQKSHGQPHRVGGRGGFDTLLNVIRWRAFIMWWFSRLKICISRLQIRRQKTPMERKSSKERSLSFLWTNENFSPRNCLSRNSNLFSSRRIGALG